MVKIPAPWQLKSQSIRLQVTQARNWDFKHCYSLLQRNFCKQSMICKTIFMNKNAKYNQNNVLSILGV